MKKIDLLIIVNIALLIVALCVFNYSDFDVQIQNYLFNFQTKTWLVDSGEPVKKFIFYIFPKILLGVAIFMVLVCALLGFYNKSPFFFENRHRFLLIFLGFTLILATVGNIKKFTNVYCPTQLEIYNGKFPHVKIFDKYDADFVQTKKAQCFPAGHPVTGFALFILFFAFKKKSHKILGLFSAFVLGWVLGLYQMAKGAHFFGHNVVSMLACFLVAALVARVYEECSEGYFL